jgi:hypothetical protein
MFQKDSHVKSEELCEQDLEQRLRAYYGPQLPPRALPETAWLQLRDQLGPATTRRSDSRHTQRIHFSRPLQVKSVQPAPVVLQEAFEGLLARVQYGRRSPELRCAFKQCVRTPQVLISPLGRGQVRLVLPEQEGWNELQPATLDVLLAVGLARYASTSRAVFLGQRALLCTLLLALAILPVATVERRFLWDMLAILACLGGVGLFSWQQRSSAFRADRQAVLWLGRERVCQGLHGLAEPTRQQRFTWNEPTLAERITRVCGTTVNAKDDRLTLVH